LFENPAELIDICCDRSV